MNKNKTALIILDGWGYGKKDSSDAVFQADTPFFDQLIREYPNSTLLTHGENVGLPEGQMGNSEVGHMNIGAGRIVYQDLVRINNSIKDGSFFELQVLKEAMRKASISNSKLHIIGLVSDGGVHSSQEHLHALCEMAKRSQVGEFFVHAFTDGRDTDPHGSLEHISRLEEKLKETGGEIATLVGRYYAMDRDKRWERIKKAYDLLVRGSGEKYDSALEGIRASHEAGITDEFIEPIVLNSSASAKIKKDDVVICFNFRTDRCREIVMALSQQDFPDYEMKQLPLHLVTMTNYDHTFENINVVFEKPDLEKTLGEVISQNGLTQVRVAETEKYPHVTFFFSGGREREFDREKRIMINSPKVATYDLQPEMSAPEVADKITNEMREQVPDFICLNFANPDMVGHTGVFKAIKKACEATDKALKQVVEVGQQLGYKFVIVADHGNADNAVNEDGSANTAHSVNPVPVIVTGENGRKLNQGILADVAPTILEMMKLEQPKEMTGRSLLD
ncbi:2,3-bisphosphoglycerate-independent phosphoglycerate mutase [Halocola ammonii]